MMLDGFLHHEHHIGGESSFPLASMIVFMPALADICSKEVGQVFSKHANLPPYRHVSSRIVFVHAVAGSVSTRDNAHSNAA